MEYIILIVIVVCSLCLFILSSIAIFFIRKKLQGDASATQDNKVKKQSTSTQLLCKMISDKYTCTDPTNKKTIITLTEGLIFKISYSIEKHPPKTGTDVRKYYIIAPYVFIINASISLATKEITVNSLQELLALFDKIDKQYISENTLPDKCLNLSVKTRGESIYGTTCIFFSLKQIDAIEGIIRKSIFPYIQASILDEYFNVLNKKIAAENPTLTILEYVMYIALLNRTSKFEYYTTCKLEGKSTDC
jgi:hypothetical protein